MDLLFRHLRHRFPQPGLLHLRLIAPLAVVPYLVAIAGRDGIDRPDNAERATMYVCSEMTLRTHAVYVIGERTRRAHDVRLVASAGRLVTPPVAGVWLASRTAAPTTGHSFTVTDAQAPAPAITP